MKTTEERFWEKVAIIPEHTCWEWIAGKVRNGYGFFRYNGKRLHAHRMSFFLQTGKMPSKDICVCHTCDNPGCVNPNHLFLGTPLENTKDKIKKGRQFHPIGEINSRSKINEEIVVEIRRMRRFNSLKEIAKHFNLSLSTISDICRGKTWKHVKTILR